MGRPSWVFIAILLGACAVAAAIARHSPLATGLGKVSGVARVERLVSPWEPKCRIIHIADYHWVSFEDLAADLRDQDPEVTEADIEAEHDRIMTAVREVQANQLRVIRWLAKEQRVEVVCLEGVTDDNLAAYVAMLREAEKDNPMRLGAAAQALMAGDIKLCAPAEDAAAYAARPLRGNAVTLDGPANDAREEAIVRRLTARGPLAVLVLGMGHDLSKHAKALGCEYIKVYVDGLPEE